MADRRLGLLKKLSKNFLREEDNGKGDGVSQPWAADFVKGKGNSLIFLLHGTYSYRSNNPQHLRRLYGSQVLCLTVIALERVEMCALP